ncbi:hypothetical protein [Xanthocytophaga flavus]|nr:hypothetical protein [Xanthocytophaga flavus]
MNRKEEHWFYKQHRKGITLTEVSMSDFLITHPIKRVDAPGSLMGKIFFDWDYYKNTCYHFTWYIDDPENVIQKRWQNSALSNKHFIYLSVIDLGFIQVETEYFINNWYEFAFYCSEGGQGFSDDGQLFFEYTEPDRAIRSNFEIKPNSKITQPPYMSYQ